MLKRFGRRLHKFYERHEKGLRTEIILVPILVVTIKLFEDNFRTSPWWIQIPAIVAIVIVSYLIGITAIVAFGDRIFRRFLFRFDELYKYRGVYVQLVGATGRKFAISRIFVDYDKGKYIYRGVAFDGETSQPAAAWDCELSHSDIIDGDPVLYFAGRSTIQEYVKYEEHNLNSRVFTILCFTSGYSFRGAGFDYTRRHDPHGDYRDSFAVVGYEVDNNAISQYGISSAILVNELAVYPHDRAAIERFVAETLKPRGIS